MKSFAAAARALYVAAWVGLAVGLLEGLLLWGLQAAGWATWEMIRDGVDARILLVSPLFDLALFLCFGLLWTLIALLLGGRNLLPWAIGFYALAGFYALLASTGRLNDLACTLLGLGLATQTARWFQRDPAPPLRFMRRTAPVLVAAVMIIGVTTSGRWADSFASTGSRLVPSLAGPQPAKPNVLLVVFDNVRADHLGAYGYPRATSPRIDAVARQGTLFEAAIATSSWTLPSHVSLVTGRFPYENHPQGTAIDPAFPTVAEAFRQRGYRTAAFSANTFFFSSHIGFGRGFLHFDDFFHSWEDRAARTLYGRKVSQFILRRLGYEDIPGRKLAADVTSATLDWIGDHPRPFLAYLNYFDVHDPYLPPQPWRDKFSARPNPGGVLNSFLLRYYPEMTAEQLQEEIAAYDGAVAYVDDEIGRLLDELDRRGLADNTLVVITSDHGEMLGEHELYLHRNCLYREAIHVPLIMRWPGQVPAGKRIASPVSIASIPATLAQLAGIARDAPFPGPSLAQLWRSAEPSPAWPDALAELGKFPFEPVKRDPAYHGAMKSLVTPAWHYIEHEKFGPQLFHWHDDPAEATDLAATPNGKPLVDRLAEQLQKRIAQPSPSHAAGEKGVPPGGKPVAGPS